MIDDWRIYRRKLERCLGRPYELSVACDSLKVRFEASEIDPRGRSYLWIDPPWRIWQGAALLRSSEDFSELFDDEARYHRAFAPVYLGRLQGLTREPDKGLNLELDRGFRLTLPWSPYDDDEDDWYHHWYVTLSSPPLEQRRLARRMPRIWS